MSKQNFDVITSHGKLDRGSKWKNVTSHAQGRAPTCATDTSVLRDVTPSTVGGAACGSGEALGEKYSGKR